MVLLACAAVWLVVGSVFGLLASLKFHAPNLLADCPWLTYGRVQPAQMNALIAPRAHLSLTGNQDALTPLAGVEKIDQELQRTYAAAGHPENWRQRRYDGGHFENPQMRAEIRQWFVQKL